MEALEKIRDSKLIYNFRLLLLFTLFVVFITIPMTFEYSTAKDGSKEYTDIVEKENPQFLGLDIFGLVALSILALTSKEIEKSILYLAAIAMLIYVLVLVSDAKPTNEEEFTKERALQAKIGFFTDGIIVGLTAYALTNYINFFK